MTNTNLIPVFSGTINNESILLCDARKLHAKLQVGRRFATWIVERIKEYGFVENQDYILTSQNGEVRRHGGHLRKDYHLTLDTAKELAMVEKNEIGRQIRRYFISCEKKLKQMIGVTTPSDRHPLRDAVSFLVGKKGLMFDEAYKLVHQRFNITHIEQLSHEQITQAVEYVHKLALEGEILPPELPSDVTTLTQSDLRAMEGLCTHMRMVRGWWYQYGNAVRGLNRQIAAAVHDHFNDGSFSAAYFVHKFNLDSVSMDYALNFPFHENHKGMHEYCLSYK